MPGFAPALKWSCCFVAVGWMVLMGGALASEIVSIHPAFGGGTVVLNRVADEVGAKPFYQIDYRSDKGRTVAVYRMRGGAAGVAAEGWHWEVISRDVGFRGTHCGGSRISVSTMHGYDLVVLTLDVGTGQVTVMEDRFMWAFDDPFSRTRMTGVDEIVLSVVEMPPSPERPKAAAFTFIEEPGPGAPGRFTGVPARLEGTVPPPPPRTMLLEGRGGLQTGLLTLMRYGSSTWFLAGELMPWTQRLGSRMSTIGMPQLLGVPERKGEKRR